MKYTEEQINEFAINKANFCHGKSPTEGKVHFRVGYIEGFKKAIELMQPPIKNHGDTICHECGAQNINWFAENELFNRINGDGNGVFCPDCFTKKAEKIGVNDIIFKAIRANDEFEPATKPLSEITDEDEMLPPGSAPIYTHSLEYIEAYKAHCIK